MNRANKQKRNKQKPRRRRVGKVRLNGQPAMVPHLSKCAVSYAQALTNPFSSFSELPCIPDTITVPSTKFASRCRGIMSVGTVGTGWVVADPFRMLINNPTTIPRNPGPPPAFGTSWPVVNTTSSYTDSRYNWETNNNGPFFNATGEVVASKSNSPYPSQKFTPDPDDASEYRLVGAGLRVRYTGTELKKGGRVTLVYGPSASSIRTGQYVSDLLVTDRVRSFPVTREWEAITYRPESTRYLDYNNWHELGSPYSDVNMDGEDPYIPPGGSPETATDHYCLLAIMDGCEPGVSFEFEVISHFEALLLPDPTSSHCDPVGFGAIMSSLPALPSANAQVSFRQAIKGALNSLKTTTSGLLTGVTAQSVGRFAGGAVRGFLQGGLGGAALNAGLASIPLIEDID